MNVISLEMLYHISNNGYNDNCNNKVCCVTIKGMATKKCLKMKS